MLISDLALVLVGGALWHAGQAYGWAWLTSVYIVCLPHPWTFPLCLMCCSAFYPLPCPQLASCNLDVLCALAVQHTCCIDCS